MAGAIPVYLEVGEKRVFASAVDWPGWTRSGKDEDAALEKLAAYASRYAAVPKAARVVRLPVSDHRALVVDL